MPRVFGGDRSGPYAETVTTAYAGVIGLRTSTRVAAKGVPRERGGERLRTSCGLMSFQCSPRMWGLEAKSLLIRYLAQINQVEIPTAAIGRGTKPDIKGFIVLCFATIECSVIPGQIDNYITER